MTDKPIKIISGRWDYVCRVSNQWRKLGWTLTKTKQWADGKWSFTMERIDGGGW